MSAATGGRAGGRARFAVLLLFPGSLVFAASLTNETFVAGAASWRSGGSLAVSAAGDGTLRGQFAAQGMPTPESGSFVATNTSSGGAFAGDYGAVRAGLLGFSFKAQQVLPSDFVVRLHGPGGSMFHTLTNHLQATGVWYRFTLSLQGRALGGWVGGDEDAFAQILNDVRWVQVYVQRSGTAAQEYFLDDVFLAASPRATAIEVQNGPVLSMTWDDLRTGIVYGVERATPTSSSWTASAVFTAAAPSVTRSVPLDGEPAEFLYRLTEPEIR
jgi:hypothetical protein